MIDPEPLRRDRPSRDFTVATFVLWRDQLMLHRHRTLGLWLPCGGHIEADELPDEAAVREVREESGVRVELVGETALDVATPVQLVRPLGVQLETISDGHEHIDLIYLARPVEPYDGTLPRRVQDPSLGWYDRAALASLPLSDEIRGWTELLFREYVGTG